MGLATEVESREPMHITLRPAPKCLTAPRKGSVTFYLLRVGFPLDVESQMNADTLTILRFSEDELNTLASIVTDQLSQKVADGDYDAAEALLKLCRAIDGKRK